MNKLRTGDRVIVLSGKDKGKIGAIKARIDDSLIVVEGVAVVTKSVKPNPMKGEEGGFKSKEMPIHQSKVAIYNGATSKADRVSIKVQVDGSRKRVYKSSGEDVRVA